MVDPFLPGPRKALAAAADKYVLSGEHVNQIGRQYAKWRLPEEAKAPIKFLDSFTNSFKNLAYPIWFPSHVRNAVSAASSNMRDSTRISAYAKMAQVLGGWGSRDLSSFPGMPPGLAADAQNQWMRHQLYTHAKVLGGHNGATDLAGVTLNALAPGGGRFTPMVPGSDRSGTTGSMLGDAAQLLKEGVIGIAGQTSPFDIRGQAGVGGRTKDTWSPLAAGRKAGMNIEDYFRGANWIGNVENGMTPAAAGARVHELHFDYDRLAPAEKNVMRRLLPFYCVPADHEILTIKGWKTYDQLDIGELVLSCNHETGELIWVPLEDVAVFDFDGELLKIERSNKRNIPTKFLFTEDHRWPVVTTKSFAKGKHYGGERKIVLGRDLNTGHTIPMTGVYLGRGSSSPGFSPRLAAILGWVVTDGYHRWRGSHCEMVIYQSPAKHLEEIVELTGNKPRAPHPETGVCAVPVSLVDVKAITDFFFDKEDLTGIVGRLDRPAADRMWDAMFKAEGWTTGTGQQGFAQDPSYNKHVLDAFQMLCLMTERSANLNGRGCYVQKEKTLGMKEGIGRERYTGKIWCPKTRYGTWVMRHDGSTIITGNTFQRNNLPLQLRTLANHPGQISTQLKPIQQRDASQFVPAYLNSGVAIPTGPEENGNQQYVSSVGLPSVRGRLDCRISPRGWAKSSSVLQVHVRDLSPWPRQRPR